MLLSGNRTSISSTWLEDVKQLNHYLNLLKSRHTNFEHIVKPFNPFAWHPIESKHQATTPTERQNYSRFGLRIRYSVSNSIGHVLGTFFNHRSKQSTSDFRFQFVVQISLFVLFFHIQLRRFPTAIQILLIGIKTAKVRGKEVGFDADHSTAERSYFTTNALRETYAPVWKCND